VHGRSEYQDLAARIKTFQSIELAVEVRNARFELDAINGPKAIWKNAAFGEGSEQFRERDG
jgi:hypothetical protein